MPIFLTSTSKRRQVLLQQLGFHEPVDFITAQVPATFEEIQAAGALEPTQTRQQSIELAHQKVKAAISAGLPAAHGLAPEETIVVGVCTHHILAGRVLARPLPTEVAQASKEQIRQAVNRARKMLEELCGREMVVVTGLVLTQADNWANQRATWSETRVKLRPYHKQDIEAYLATGEGLGEPGGLNLLGRGVVLHEKISGAFSNLGGLPLAEFFELLQHPMFAGRTRLRLGDEDRGRFSTPVQVGPARYQIVSLTGNQLDFDQARRALKDAQVLHVPGSLFKKPDRHSALLDLMVQAKKDGKLVVLDDSLLAEQAVDPQVAYQLNQYAVDCRAAGPLTKQQLASYMAPRVLLASKSPRRRELLGQIIARNQFEVWPSQNEEPYLDETPLVRVQRLALEKARAVYGQKELYSPSIEVVIGADTEVALDGQALGKPASAKEAREQLRLLQGRTHRVMTGMAFISTLDGREVVDCVETLVRFRKMSSQEIETYIDSGEPFGKAGAYGIQGKGALFVEAIDGSYSNVVGLPLERLAVILDQEFNLPIWTLDPVAGWRLPHQY